MMMTQPFPAHQGMQQHGFPPGHPMNAQHPNGHPGPGMVQQMHPGVSAPGGPQVSQTGPMMGGMQPGGTAGPGVPNAHALSHLNPAQAHMLQGPQFQQNFANNPQFLQQHQHQQLMRQRMMLQQQQQHQQQQQQQQQQQHGLPVSMPNGTQGINAAQMAAMQGNPGMRPMMHLPQQMPHGQPQNFQHQQQFLAIQQAQQQAQAQAQAQAQQQANNGQPGQHTPQRASAQPPNMHEQSGTPQSQHGGPPQGNGTPQPSQTSQPPSSQPPPSQGPPQGQGTPNPPSQQLPQSQQPGQPGQAGPQPQHPQNAQGQQPGPQNQQMTPQEIQLKAQQHQMMIQQQRMKQQNQSIMALNAYSEQLGNFVSRNEAQDLLYWNSFVDRFYSPGGVLRQGVWNNTAGSKQFEIATPALARYYLTQFMSGITRIQMVVEGARERESHNGGHYVEANKCSFIYWFKNECQLFTDGSLRAHFDVNNKLEMLDINVINHQEFIPRSLLLAMEAEQKQSPKVPKNSKRTQQKSSSSVALPDSMVNPNGVPTEVMGFLEVAETISQMQMLFQFSQSNPQLAPHDALRNLVNTLQTQNPNPGYAPAPMNPGMNPMNPAMSPGMNPAMNPMNPSMSPGMNPAMQPMQNVRGHSMGAPSQFASPAMAHLGLPGQQGSPHLTGSAHASPAQTHLAGPPGMQPPMQPSPAGVNNSPNVGGKRRRASTVKMESEDGAGVDANGAPQGSAKVKASPRVPKRQKGAAA